MWPWWVKIPTEDFTYVTLTIGDTMEMMFEVAMGVMDMEDDKVADMVLMIPNEDFSGGTVAIGDTQWDDVRGNDGLDMEVDKMVQSGATSGG